MSDATDLKIKVRGSFGRLRRDRSALTVFLFHALFQDEAEVALHLIKPQQALTVAHFEQFIQHYQAAGYRFVSPDDLDAGLPIGGRYVMATFDDGYFNNRLALPIMQRYGVPVVFFISTGHVLEGKCFWWDVLHRRRMAEGATDGRIAAEAAHLKPARHDAIEAYLREQFGDGALGPVSDVDRPFTPEELAEFSREPLVHLGNHTSQHALLTQYPPDEVERLVSQCQDDLERMCGERPTIISYPNGNHDAAAIEVSRQVGMRWGITVQKRKTYLPLPEDAYRRLTLGRHTLWGQRDIDAQCRMIRADFSRRGWRAARGRPTAQEDGG